MMGNARVGEKRGRLLRKAMCTHIRNEHMIKWKETTSDVIAMDVAQLQHYVLNSETNAATVDLSSELYCCLSCKFRGYREIVREKLHEAKNGEDDGTFMAHAILQNHNIAVLERKRQLYCASCRDFIYPATAVESEALQRKRQICCMMTPHKLLRRGLVNMGNTCYMSSVLQTLAHNPMLQHYFFVAKCHDTAICQKQRQRLLMKRQQQQLEGETQTKRHDDHVKECKDAKDDSDVAIAVCLGCELATFMTMLIPPAVHASRETMIASPIVLQGILEAMWNAFPSFIGTAQHDAHELLIALLGGLHSHTHPRVFVHGGASPRFTPRGHSLCDCAVHQHFSGVLRSKLACESCGFASYKFDPFLDVSLSLSDEESKHATNEEREKQVSGSSAMNLESLLRQFAAEEELRGANQVYCLRCSKYQNHYKSLNLHTLPNVLVFHIRRLDFNRQQKLLQNVGFPLTGLDMRPFTSVGIDEVSDCKEADIETSVQVDDQSEYVYDLVALVSHHGDSVNGGHYTSYVRDEVYKNPTTPIHSKQLQWILFDDVHVKIVSGDKVESSQAYLLCYVRRNPFIAVTA